MQPSLVIEGSRPLVALTLDAATLNLSGGEAIILPGAARVSLGQSDDVLPAGESLRVAAERPVRGSVAIGARSHAELRSESATSVHGFRGELNPSVLDRFLAIWLALFSIVVALVAAVFGHYGPHLF